MKDPQKLRQEARGFLDKANATTDRAVRRLLLERALRLVQQAGMIEQAPGIEVQASGTSIRGSTQAVAPGSGRRRA